MASAFDEQQLAADGAERWAKRHLAESLDPLRSEQLAAVTGREAGKMVELVPTSMF